METIDATEVLNNAVRCMTFTNWLMVQRTMDMTKEEIVASTDAMAIVGAWWAGEHTKGHLVELMNMPYAELMSVFGIDLDAAEANAVDSVA